MPKKVVNVGAKTLLASIIFFFALIEWTCSAILDGDPILVRRNDLKLAGCEVFNPFKVIPNGSERRLQLGGAFPLHYEDCQTLRLHTVQEIVAIQWSLSLLNKVEQKGRQRSKLGLFAGDTCSRSKEAISQTLRFLDSVGYHEPAECQQQTTSTQQGSPASQEQLLAVIAPKDAASAEAVGSVLKPSGIPMIGYTTESVQALIDSGHRRIVSAAPLLDDYLEMFSRLLRELNGSNLVSIVDTATTSDENSLASKVAAWFRSKGVFVADVIGLSHPMLAQVLAQSDARVIVSLTRLTKEMTRKNWEKLETISKLKKLWVFVDWKEHDEVEEANDFSDLLKRPSTNLQSVHIRRKVEAHAEFKAYFLRVLLGNYGSYALLTRYVQDLFYKSYVEQTFNCTSASSPTSKLEQLLPKCTDKISMEQLAEQHQQAPAIDSLLKLVFAIGRAIEAIEAAPACQGKGVCCEAFIDGLLSLGREEEESRLSSSYHLSGYERKETKSYFYRTNTSDGRVVAMSGSKLEAILVAASSSALIASTQLLELVTGQEPLEKRTTIFEIPESLRSLHSTCRSYRSYCGACNETSRQRSTDEVFLVSPPKEHALYITGLFDLYGAEGCSNRVDEHNSNQEADAISLPLAFVYAISSFKQRYSSLSQLFDFVDVGGLLYDTCGKEKNLLEFLIDSEHNCFKFSQAEQNWSVPAISTVAYVSATHAAQNDIILPGAYRMLFGSAGSTPLVFLDGKSTPGLFTPLPHHRKQAIALTKWLEKMHWDYVNVVVEKDDADSLNSFRQFETVSSGVICVADLMFIVGVSGVNDVQQQRKHRSSGKNEEVVVNDTGAFSVAAKISANLKLSANVTLVFSKPKSASAYMSSRLRLGTELPDGHVHVMIGASHNFYLYDPSNLASYVGSVSVQPKDISMPDFHEWLHTLTPLVQPEPWFWSHVEEHWHCALSLKNVNRFQGRMCTGEEILNVKAMGRLTRAGYLIKAVDHLLLAILSANARLCTNEQIQAENELGTGEICDAFLKKGQNLVRELLTKSLAGNSEADAFEIYEFQPLDHHGNFGYKVLANCSVADDSLAQFNTIDKYRPFVNGIPVELATVSRCRSSSLCGCRDSRSAAHASTSETEMEAETTPFGLHNRQPTQYGPDSDTSFLIYDTAVEVYLANSTLTRYVFLAMTSLFVSITAGILILICVKMYFRIVKGNQSLGIVLLLGIIGLYATGYAYTISPSETVCCVRIFMHTIAHSLCFAILIVKALQLKNADTLAVPYATGMTGENGHQISQWNYWLLLIFTMSVQVVGCFKWVSEAMERHPSSGTSEDFLRCTHPQQRFFGAQAYNFALLLLSLLLNWLNRNIKRNYKEAKWLLTTSMLCTPIMSLWLIVTYTFASSIYVDYFTLLELYLMGTIMLVFLFGPKLYVLLSYEPVIVECNMTKTEVSEKNADLFNAEMSPAAVNTNYPHSSVSPSFSTRSTDASSVWHEPIHRHKSSHSQSSTDSESWSRSSTELAVGVGSPLFQTVLVRKKSHLGKGLINPQILFNK